MVQQIFSGLPAASGIGIGSLYIYSPAPIWARRSERAKPGAPEVEWARFVAARQKVDGELAHLGQFGDPMLSEIFLVHREILHDQTLTDAVQSAVTSGVDAATATQQATAELVRVFQNLSDSYFANRAADIRDVGQRLLSHLDGVSLTQQLKFLPSETILLAEDLTPFDTTHLSTEQVTGIALAGSAPTAHTAILARSLGLPLICGVGGDALSLRPGLHAIVDGIQGRLFVSPDNETLQGYLETQKRLAEFRATAEAQTHESATTRDGTYVSVRVNVNSREDVLLVSASGADGVGLLRTEYLFQERTSPPSIQEQIEAYREIAHHFPGRILTVRLLDVGGDKPVQYLPQPAETNPFLGVRGVRILLKQPQILQNQLQALVQLAVEDPISSVVRILVPMVTKVNEVYQVLEAFNRIPNVADLRGPNGPLQLGLMIEVPSAALLAHKLAPLVDFFNIGTNDLSQYTLAADRINSAVAALASSLDPSVLRLISLTADAGRQANIPVTVCGELAGDPSVIPLLLGLGVTEVSVVAPSVALVKQAVRQTDLVEARHLANQALDCSRAQEVERLLRPVSPHPDRLDTGA